MEGLSINAYNGFSRYWRRKRYERLNGPPTRKARFQLSRFSRSSSSSTGGGGGWGRQRRRRLWRWRIKISPKIRVGSPKKWLARLRDAYVNMMLRFANSGVFNGAAPLDYNGGFGRAPIKEYDDKMIIEIYKSVVMAQGQILPRDTPNHPSQSQSGLVCCGR